MAEVTSIALGFSNNIYDNPADVAASVALISRHFKAIEIELAEEAQPAVLEAADDDYERLVAELRSLAIQHELVYSVHAAWFGPHTNLTSSEDEERRASVALLERSIRFAADIAAPIVTFHPGYRRDETGRALLENLLRALELLDGARRAAPSVMLCLENMGAQRRTQAVFDAAEHAEICERTGIGVCLDLVHLATLYPDLEAMRGAFDLVIEHVHHVHIADMMRPTHRHLPIGEGDLPLVEMLSELARRGYRGQGIVEEFTRGYPAEAYLTAALAFRAALAEPAA